MWPTLLLLLLQLLSRLPPTQALSQPPPPKQTGFPPLPWTFSNARILYQPAWVPIEAAREATPSDLFIPSLFGWTLGGIFAVDWASSPVGPYREVAVLSALVWQPPKGWSNPGGIGAWASHIVVTENEAADAARELFGLPAVVGSLEFDGALPQGGAKPSDGAIAWKKILGGARKILEDLGVALKYASGSALPGLAEPAERLRPPTAPASPDSLPPRRRFVFESPERVVVEGWDGWEAEEPAAGSDQAPRGGGFSLTLPSFSGRLPVDEGGRTPLLRYDLTLGPARSVKLRPSVATDARFLAEDPPSARLKGVLGGPLGGLPCLAVDGVRVVAGTPEAVGE